jgi:glutamate-1-semialdehyde aminotransferase
MNTNKSAELFEKAKTYFPGGVNSPVRAFRSVGGNPLFIEKGKGSQIWDADGNQYTDYCCSWGPLILGHANDKVLYAVEAPRYLAEYALQEIFKIQDFDSLFYIILIYAY